MMNELMAIAATGVFLSALLLWVVMRMAPPGFLAAQASSRSNHTAPARQLGGLAVIPALVGAVLLGAWLEIATLPTVIWLSLAVAILFTAGLLDDSRDLTVTPKLLLQVAAAVVAVAGSFQYSTAFAPLSAPIASALLVLVLVSAINLINFMDGIDLMVVAGIGLPSLTLGLFGVTGVIAVDFPLLLSLALGSALLPFAIANRPPASVFLGDNGSLPIGLIAGAIGIGLAANYSVAAGSLPFAYFIVDSGLTLLQRIIARKNIFTAHSEHAYQIARRAGLSAASIAGRVGIVSIATTGISVLICADMIGPLLGMTCGYAIAVTLFAMLKWQR